MGRDKKKNGKKHPKKLSAFLATAICGNDILSSSLYVSGIAIIFAGVYAPLVLLVVAFVLFLYKKVYREVVEALPVNGGAYNCLLNGTSKTVASFAGVMTILSYVATAVISAKIAVEYANTVFSIPVIPVTILLLFLFALLVISGIRDSAKVAATIFLFHIFVLCVFLFAAGFFFFRHGFGEFSFNLSATQDIVLMRGGILKAFYLAFSASLLGVSGFESSANFVEEQERGVFPKTLRNMLIGVTIFNPLIALAVLSVLPIDAIAGAKDFLLADAARFIGGQALQYIIVADAVLVLSGAVLTSYVGVSGLMSRMSLDRALPYFFSKENKRGSFPRIVLSFFLLCSSILLLTGGQLLSLAGVYTIAFLGVMTMFAFGNLVLKENRSELKRTYRAPIFVVVCALLATLFGILGNIRIDARNLTFFGMYFLPAMAIVFVILYQDYILKFFLRITRQFPRLNNFFFRRFDGVVRGEFVVFVHHWSRLYPIVRYIDRNETGWNITLVHCKSGSDGKEAKKAIEKVLDALKYSGVFPHLRMKLVYRNEAFGPAVVDKVAKKMKIQKNRIFIGSIHHAHKFDYDDLGGVRIIF